MKNGYLSSPELQGQIPTSHTPHYYGIVHPKSDGSASNDSSGSLILLMILFNWNPYKSWLSSWGTLVHIFTFVWLLISLQCRSFPHSSTTSSTLPQYPIRIHQSFPSTQTWCSRPSVRGHLTPARGSKGCMDKPLSNLRVSLNASLS